MREHSTNQFRLTGLTAATVTPLQADGRLNLSQVRPVVDHLVANGVRGLYVCGSTGEGVSLQNSERRAVAEAYVAAADGRLPVVVQVGQNCLDAACRLAEHAQSIGADAVSAMPPSYFKVDNAEMLVEVMAHIASSSPDVPFYYYHIPRFTGANSDMVEFLRHASNRIPNLIGIKFTSPELHQFQRCLEFENGKYDIQWGTDEMLLGAIATGATGGVGSTYNIAAPVYLRMIEAFQEGDLTAARHWQSRAVAFIQIMASVPFNAALREVLKVKGLDCGYSRLPQRKLTASEAAEMLSKLEAIGFFDWSCDD